MSLSLLLIEPDPRELYELGGALRRMGHQVRGVGSAEEALERLSGVERYHLVIADLEPADVGELRSRTAPDCAAEFLMLGADAGDPRAVAAVRESVAGFLTKPLDPAQLAARLSEIERRLALEEELRRARAALAGRDQPELVGRSAAIRRVMEVVEAFGPSDASALITGETGTGKEVVAQLLHRRSARASKPLVSVNCAAIPESLFEAELFGYERGAFTGATGRRDGRFKAADGGTLFLDEVAEIPMAAQAKLVRVLQERTFEPLGTNRPVRVDVRIISATHRDLVRRVAEGSFRQDLYYRLNTLPLALPALRERPGDLPLLVEHFLRRFTSGGRVPGLTEAAWATLSSHRFPGNVRELEHAIQHALVMARGRAIDVCHLPRALVDAADSLPDEPANGFRHLHHAVKEFERNHIIRALRLTHGRKTEAAALLGISRKNLWEKLRAHGLSASVEEIDVRDR